VVGAGALGVVNILRGAKHFIDRGESGSGLRHAVKPHRLEIGANHAAQIEGRLVLTDSLAESGVDSRNLIEAHSTAET